MDAVLRSVDEVSSLGEGFEPLTAMIELEGVLALDEAEWSLVDPDGVLLLPSTCDVSSTGGVGVGLASLSSITHAEAENN